MCSEDECHIHRLPSEAPQESVQVLVTCHSLVRFDEDLVGDPLEKACLSWAEWNLTKSNFIYMFIITDILSGILKKLRIYSPT